MSSLNKKPTATPKTAAFTHEGARAFSLNPQQELQRSCMNALLWEDAFYEGGEEHTHRVRALIAACPPEFVAGLAITARTDMKLRHMPLFLVREMARLATHKHVVAATLPQIIKRADELTEFLAIYWKEKRQPLSAQVKKGLAKAFLNFREHDFAKYDRDGAVKLRDALFLSHAKPADATVKFTKQERKDAAKPEAKLEWDLKPGEQLFKKIVDRTLATPETWEVQLSAGADKKATFTSLMLEKKLGGLAFLRNLRNMQEAGVDHALVNTYVDEANFDRVLPFRFIAAARHVPAWESIIERGMLRALAGAEKLPGHTVLAVDNSGSMRGPKVSAKSEIDRADAAGALAILLREICERVTVLGFSTHTAVIPDRHGFALAEGIKRGPSGGTDIGQAVRTANAFEYDRLIVITDEQSHTAVPPPRPDTKGYFINVATFKHGVGYGPWVHIDGWSEAIIEYIRVYEGSLK